MWLRGLSPGSRASLALCNAALCPFAPRILAAQGAWEEQRGSWIGGRVRGVGAGSIFSFLATHFKNRFMN